jgi:hypothetical protein
MGCQPLLQKPFHVSTRSLKASTVQWNDVFFCAVPKTYVPKQRLIKINNTLDFTFGRRSPKILKDTVSQAFDLGRNPCIESNFHIFFYNSLFSHVTIFSGRYVLIFFQYQFFDCVFSLASHVSRVINIWSLVSLNFLLGYYCLCNFVLSYLCFLSSTLVPCLLFKCLCFCFLTL